MVLQVCRLSWLCIQCSLWVVLAGVVLCSRLKAKRATVCTGGFTPTI